MPYTISSATYGERLATAAHIKFAQSKFPGFSTYLQLIDVNVDEDTHTLNPFLHLHYGNQLYPFFIKVIGGLGLHVRVSGGEINFFIQNFKGPDDSLIYDYPEIGLYATRFEDLTENPTFPVFTILDPSDISSAMLIGKNLIVERTTEKSQKIEPLVSMSRKIVICRN